MESYDVLAAAQMLFRWIHVFAAMLWIGQTFLFHLMERHLVPAPSSGGVGRMWMLHGGGYYQVDKKPFSPEMPEQLVWFRWEAATTWVSGIVLLGLAYHGGGLMVEAGMNPAIANSLGMASLILGWIVYDMLVRSPLAGRPLVLALVGFVLLLLLHNGLTQIMSGRAAYIHVGAVIGTIMAANVWMRILPSQKKMLHAARTGEEADRSVAKSGPLRSRHNSFLVLPLVLIMISNHYPTISYGNDYSTVILGGMLVVGWVAAWFLLGRPAEHQDIGTSTRS